MTKNMTKLCLILSCIFGLEKMHAVETQPFFLPCQNGAVVEGYFFPPATPSSPIVFAIQGSSCASAFQWHSDLCDQVGSLGLGLIVLEKQGIYRDGINLLEYSQTNCLQKRLEDYAVCLENLHEIIPGWQGKVIFWGESEGGMLAANLAGQMPETAAVLLFATGGGMKPREEVKWTICHRLEEYGASQDEIDQYMTSLDEQIDVMMLDPTPNKQFLGNTYKWWASLLAADEVLAPLSQLPLLIYLVHGVQDNKIPILSADLAAEILKKTNSLTYLRLEEYGHDLDHPHIRTAAFQWLKSTLFGEAPVDSDQATTEGFSTATPSVDWKTDISQYVLSRGRDEGGGFDARGGRDADGNQHASGSVYGSTETDNGGNFDWDVSGEVNRDRDGNTRGEISVEWSGTW